MSIKGHALKLPLPDFSHWKQSLPKFSALVDRHLHFLLFQAQHNAMCHGLHSVEARLARWLLQVRDRADGDVLPLTQETLAEFLGVRRTTVTQVISKLRDSGAIRSNARSSIEIDRPRLEAAACECYQLMRRRIDRIVLTEEKKSRPLGYEIPLFANADEVRRRTTTQGVTGQRPRGH